MAVEVKTGSHIRPGIQVLFQVVSSGKNKACENKFKFVISNGFYNWRCKFEIGDNLV